jgi:hypothetical protein
LRQKRGESEKLPQKESAMTEITMKTDCARAVLRQLSGIIQLLEDTEGAIKFEIGNLTTPGVKSAIPFWRSKSADEFITLHDAQMAILSTAKTKMIDIKGTLENALRVYEAMAENLQ